MALTNEVSKSFFKLNLSPTVITEGNPALIFWNGLKRLRNNYQASQSTSLLSKFIFRDEFDFCEFLKEYNE